MLLVQGRGEMAVLPAYTEVLSHQTALNIWRECKVVCTGYRENSGSACIYLSTVKSQCYGYMD